MDENELSYSEKRREYWAGQAEAWKTSGLSRAEFARREGLKGSRLRWWIQRLEENGAAFVEVKAAEVPQERTMQDGADCGVWLEVGSVRISVSPRFDKEVLSRVLEVLGRNRACS